MSNKGTFGWKGKGSRALEFPAGFGVDVAPAGRARVRYNESSGELELSTNGGAYLALSVGAGGAVADIAAMAALDDGALADGATVSMASVGDLWSLDKTSTLVPDGITVVAATTGNWVRRNAPTYRWADQLNWYVDAVTGDDENDGSTAGTALQTVAELLRRIRGVTINVYMQVYLLTDITENITVDTDFTSPGGIAFYGTPTVLGSGTISAVASSWSAAAKTDGEITVAGLPVSFAASGYLHQWMRLTSGPNAGAFGYLAAEPALKTARIGFYDPATFQSINPVGTPDFEVYSLTRITGTVLLQHQGFVFFQDLEITGSATTFTVLQSFNAFYMLGCKFGIGLGYYIDLYAPEFQTFINCAFDLAESIYANGCPQLLFQNGYLNNTPILLWGATINLSGWNHADGAGARIATPHGPSGVQIGTNNLFASYDKTGATAVLDLSNGSTATIHGAIFGTGANGFGARLEATCALIFTAATTLADHFAVTGVLTADVRYGATDATYAAIGAGAIDVTTNAAVVPAN